jgi:DNA-binding MarR family transcriptional regulator
MATATAVVEDGAIEAASGSPTARLGRAWREVRRGAVTGRVVEKVFGRPGEPDSVDPGHLDVLDLLSHRDGRRMSELATALHVDPSTVTRTMHRMEAAGLARRQATEADGRVVTAHLTDEGRRLHALVAARRTALIDAAFGELSVGDREQLVELLERFLVALGQHATDTSEPAG